MMKSFFLIVVSALMFYLVSCKRNTEVSKAQQTAIHYLYLPALISDTFSRVMWHPAIDFRGLDTKKDLLYFITKKELVKADMLNILTIDSTQIEYAPCESGMCEFGGMRGNIDGYYAFRIPASNLKIDTTKFFKYKYNNTTLEMSFQDLVKELDDSVYYNTAKAIDLTHYFGREVYASNIGAYISKKGKDNVIKKLADRITEGLKSNEEKAQALLQYVTTNISYSYEDLWYETEVAKRAHEVLLSGDGDCSGKTTLYASLLEQCDIPYCLLYYKNHVNVGVQGNYANENGYTETVENKKYAVAETTVENFIIGKTKVDKSEIISDLLFYQDPHTSPNIFNAKTKEKFEFAEFEGE